MNRPGFVHLSVHTEFSLVDSTIRLQRPGKATGDRKDRHREDRFATLTEFAAESGFAALAITDLNNLFGWIKYYKAAEKAGIKPIVGADLRIEPAGGKSPERAIVLARNQDGYRNLVALVSRAHTEGQSSGHPRIQRQWIFERPDGLIVLLGQDSDVGRSALAGHFEAASGRLGEWRDAIGDGLYLEVQRCGRPDDETHVQASVQLARRHGIPVVATNDVRFLRAKDFDAHEARLCIARGEVMGDSRRRRDVTTEQYLKSTQQMQKLFKDLPQALENTVEVARRCTVEIEFGTNHLPEFPVPQGHDTSSYLGEISRKGLQRRLEQHTPVQPRPDYEARLAHELKIIEQMGFSGYFLVVADFIAWAKEHGVPVGPGRGSGAGSLVAWALGITDLDPLPYGLLFERFLNPERVSLPDFDIDFCMEGRDRVIEYVADRYGRDHVGQIITYGTMAARAVVRDACRILGHPWGLGDRIAKMIPGGPAGMSLGQALDEVAELKAAYKAEDEVSAIIDIGLQLEGLTRNVGKHAGGVVIAPRPLTDFAPLFCEPGGGGLVTQFDMKDLEAIGLIKFDFLGLKTLTIAQKAVDLINAQREPGAPKVDLLKIPLDDPEVYKLYASGNTTAVFQMESGGMQRVSVDLKPDRFEDLIALISLFRPGPMDLIPEYVARKRGKAPEYLHPAMEQALSPTLGIFVYQEQVMQIAQQLAGYTLGGADLLRRAMGKKIKEEMEKQRDVFIKGATERGVRPGVARAIFDQMESFAEYGFNKSHAAAYALVSYQTAWLKTHHPADYMAAVLSCDMDKTDTVVMMVAECRRMGIKVRAPDINRSGFEFTVTGPMEVLYGLGAIKGAGQAALTGLIAEREANGPFRDLFDLCRRTDLRKANKRVLEALVGSGALDGLGSNRPSLMKTLPKAMQMAEQAAANQGAGQTDLFGLGPTTPDNTALVEQAEDWPELERLRVEKETLGFYFSGHPIEMYRGMLSEICHGDLKSLIDSPGSTALMGGWVIEVRRIQKRWLLTLDDRSAQLTCILGEDLLGSRPPPRKDTLLFVQGRVAPDDFTGGWKVFPNEIYTLEQVQDQFAERILLSFEEADVSGLTEALSPLKDPRGCPITVHYRNGAARATLDLDDDWRIRVSETGLAALRRLLGESNVRVMYRSPRSGMKDAA